MHLYGFTYRRRHKHTRKHPERNKKEKHDRVVSSPSSCPPRSGFAHDPRVAPSRPPTQPERLWSGAPPRSRSLDPPQLTKLPRALVPPQLTKLPLLASLLSTHSPLRARVPPLYHPAPPPFHLPPLLPARAGNFSKEAFSRQIGDAPSLLYLSFSTRRVESLVLAAETPPVRGRGGRVVCLLSLTEPGFW